MEKFFDSLNLYPHQISFQHKNKSIFYSIYGLIFSAISYAIIIFLIFYFSHDLFYRTNPKIKIRQTQINDNIEFKFCQLFSHIGLDLEIKFNIIDDDFDKENLFKETFALSFKSYMKKENDEIFYIDKGNSSYEKLNSSEYKYSYKLNLQITNQTKLFIKNKNKKIENQTKDLNDVKIKLKDLIFLSIFYQFEKPKSIDNYTISKADKTFEMIETSIDPDKFNNYSNQSKHSISFMKGESYFFMYKMVEFQTELDPIFKNVGISYIPQIDFFYFNPKKYLFENNPDSEKLIWVYFRDGIERYKRIYKKILDVCSELGGIFNPIFIIGKFLVFNFNEKKYKLNILNHILTDEDIKKEFSNKQKNIKNQTFNGKINSIVKKSQFFYDEKFDFGEKKNHKSKINDISFQKSEKIDNLEMKNLSNDSCIFYNTNLKNEKQRSFIRDNSIFENKNYKNLIKNPKDNNFSDYLNKNEDQLKRHNINGNHSKSIFMENSFIVSKKIDENEQIEEMETINQINYYLSIVKERKNKLLQYSFIEIIISLLFCRKFYNKDLHDKQKIYQKIYQKLNFYFEITNIMRLYENFERMKFILFNENQINCFDYMIHDINFNKNKKEEEILNELSIYFKKKNHNYFYKNFDESIKSIMKNEIKNIIVKE